MKTVIVRSKLSEQQHKYLKLLAAEFRARPGDLLLALAFSRAEQEDGPDNDGQSHFLRALIDFVDRRRIPEPDPTCLSVSGELGRIAVEVPRA